MSSYKRQFYGVGSDVGFAKGDAVGIAVGTDDGFAVGDDVGFAVGSDVGFAVGSDVGFAVGDDVGFAVGDSVIMIYVVGCFEGGHVKGRLHQKSVHSAPARSHSLSKLLNGAGVVGTAGGTDDGVPLGIDDGVPLGIADGVAVATGSARNK
jgi:hypothetical protein